MGNNYAGIASISTGSLHPLIRLWFLKVLYNQRDPVGYYNDTGNSKTRDDEWNQAGDYHHLITSTGYGKQRLSSSGDRECHC